MTFCCIMKYKSCKITIANCNKANKMSSENVDQVFAVHVYCYDC